MSYKKIKDIGNAHQAVAIYYEWGLRLKSNDEAVNDQPMK